MRIRAFVGLGACSAKAERRISGAVWSTFRRIFGPYHQYEPANTPKTGLKRPSELRHPFLRHTLLVVFLATSTPAVIAADPGVQALRHMVTLQSGLLAEQVEELTEQRSDLQEAWVRLRQQQVNLLTAQKQGESVDSLRLRDQDLRTVEGEVMMQIFEGQRLRRAVISSRTLIEEAEKEIIRLKQGEQRLGDSISGTWDVVLEPGGQKGEFYLRLDGTLVEGTYQLDGGWQGSLRGTLVAGKVRLERIDAQIGFAAIFYGQVVKGPDGPRLQGRWEATQLATGMPAAGAWVANRR